MTIRLQSLLLFLFLAPLAWAASDELDEERRKLRDSDKQVRMAAVKRLAKRDEPEAWMLVLEALSDPTGEVADSAQWALGELDDPELLDELRGKAGLRGKEPLLRERVAEIHGRLPGTVDADLLRKALSDREPTVRRALSAAIATRGADGVGGERAKLAQALEKAAGKDKDGRAAGEALLALAALDPDRARAWWGAQKLPRLKVAVRCAAARGAEALGLDAAALGTLAAGGEPPVRVEASDALTRLGTAAAARALVDLLEPETEKRLALRIVDRLRELSGRKYGRDPRSWRDWADGLGADWSPASPAEGEAAGDEERDRSAALVGLPILSERVTFLIDFSGSMWNERDGGRTRKEEVDIQLRECLEALPESTRFNVIPYTAAPIPWKKEQVPATSKNVKAALEWFEGRKDRGTGNFWDAFLLALEDPEVDTVVMLGDGAPSGGVRYRVELLPELLYHENLGRAVVVDSILVDTKSKRIRSTWEEIARRTGGQSLSVSL
ncbi:MAG: HEAT repeat domain-containing protein [Planctomycetota bacterium]